jgi:hypothetical protein
VPHGVYERRYPTRVLLLLPMHITKTTTSYYFFVGKQAS